MPVSKSDAVIIIGGGAFGLSTALHLTQAGYSAITILERDTQIPARFSAANDLNKIVRAEYEDPFYTDLTIVCIFPPLHSWSEANSPYRKLSRLGRHCPFLRHTFIRSVSYTAFRVTRRTKPCRLWNGFGHLQKAAKRSNHRL